MIEIKTGTRREDSIEVNSVTRITEKEMNKLSGNLTKDITRIV